MKVVDLSLSGLKLILPKVFCDSRGYFFESFHSANYKDLGIADLFVQDNVSFSKFKTIRALHYQSHPGQAKLVSCSLGKILDVAVDIRPASPTFGKWEMVELSDENHYQMFVPIGFAHGYCVLSDVALVHYKVSSFYNPKTEGSIRWNDPDLNISWPWNDPVLSDRDRTSPFFKDVNIELDALI